MSAYTDRDAYRMHQHGVTTIVTCGTCEERYWTDNVTYDVSGGHWFCDACYTEPERHTMDTSELED